MLTVPNHALSFLSNGIADLERNPPARPERRGGGSPRPCPDRGRRIESDAGTKALLRAESGRCVRPDDAAGLERSPRVPRLRVAECFRFHRAERRVRAAPAVR